MKNNKVSFGKKVKLMWQDWKGMSSGDPYPSFLMSQMGDFYGQLYKRVEKSFSSGHYDAGKIGRLQEDWTTTTGSPTQNYKQNWKTIIARSIHASDNDPSTVDIMNAFCNNVIGTGIRPLPRVRNKNGTLIEGVNKSLEEGWKRYNDQWAADGHGSFLENQNILFREVFTTGATFINKVASQPGSFLSIQNQIPSILRLDASHDIQPTGYNVPEIANTVFGINLNDNGRAVSFWIQGLDQPVSGNTLSLHFRKLKAEEYLPPPWLASALKYLWANEQLVKDTLIASRIQTMINLFVPTSAMKGVIKKDLNTNDQVKMTAGEIWTGKAGEPPEVVESSNSVKEVLEPMQRLLMHAITMTQGMSYQTVTRDMAKMNMASAKVNNNEDRKTYRKTQKGFSNETLQPEWNTYVRWMFAEGKIDGKTITDYIADPWKYNQVLWQPPGFDFIDFAREAKGHIELVGAKMETLEQWFSEWRGTDWRVELEQMALEEKFMREKGLNRDDVIRNVSAQPSNEDIQDVKETQDERED